MPASKYANPSAVPLSLAVFLATDSYDYNDDPNTISTTTLIKPVRQTILAARVPAGAHIPELVSMIPSRIGSAIHDGIERSWKNNYQQALVDLGHAPGLVRRIRVNPSDEELAQGGIIPVYMEQRIHRKVGKYTVSGKFDFIGDGRVEDFKTTSTFSAMSHSNDEKFTWQGSIYRWLDPKKITKDEMLIQFIFTDWSSMRAKQDPNYPQQRFLTRTVKLKSIEETDSFINYRISQLDRLWDAPEDQLPLCTDEELWRSSPVYKWYKNGDTNAARSSKNFDDRLEAYTHVARNGGAIKDVPGQVTACRYCPAFQACTQKDALVAAGDLIL
jgi:hypothetical protein